MAAWKIRTLRPRSGKRSQTRRLRSPCRKNWHDSRPNSKTRTRLKRSKLSATWKWHLRTHRLVSRPTPKRLERQRRPRSRVRNRISRRPTFLMLRPLLKSRPVRPRRPRPRSDRQNWIARRTIQRRPSANRPNSHRPIPHHLKRLRLRRSATMTHPSRRVRKSILASGQRPKPARFPRPLPRMSRLRRNRPLSLQLRSGLLKPRSGRRPS